MRSGCGVGHLAVIGLSAGRGKVGCIWGKLVVQLKHETEATSPPNRAARNAVTCGGRWSDVRHLTPICKACD